MAEYYPLISRAVAGLRTAAPEARKAIYDRARQALVSQLRNMDPPVPEDAITRETAALDEAIARAEAEIAPAPAGAEPPKPAAPVLQPPAPEPRGAAPAAAGPGDSPRPVPPRPEPPRTFVRPSNTRPAAPGGDAKPTKPERPPARPAPAVPGPGRTVPPAVTLPAVNALKVEGRDDSPASADIGPALSASRDDLPGNLDEPTVSIARDLQDEKARDESARPAAPRPTEPRRPNLRIWIVTVAALAAVVVIAFAAWRLRDNPQEMARAPAAQAPVATPAGKIVERADGTAASAAAEQGAVTVDQATQTATEAPAAPPASGSASDPTNPVTTPPPADTASTAAVVPSAAPQAPGAPAIPIAYKAAVLVDAPDLPEKVKTYVGTVVWRTENVTQGQNQPIGMAIQADVTIPDAKIQLVLRIRRNTEPQFPASHTLDLNFTVASDSPLGTIKQINVPQMRQQDLPTGEALAGIPVTIADNNFLVGLMRGNAEDRNLELLRSRGWFDIPMLLANGKASKITFEKGTAGDRIFAEVLDGWKNAQN